MEVIQKAKLVAESAHNGARHKRKISDEPYITHPAYAATNARIFYDLHSRQVTQMGLLSKISFSKDNIIAAAWLHDVIEDTGLELPFIEREFPAQVYHLVDAMTDEKRESETRKERLESYISKMSDWVEKFDPSIQLLKLADISANFSDIMKSHDNPDPKYHFNNYERFINEKLQIINSFKYTKDFSFHVNLVRSMEEFLDEMKRKG